jgi:EAL and modified HD-GYP domain-containing signal transduction protein
MTPGAIFLGRQPILDLKHELVAYELLFRASPMPNRAIVTNGAQATATVITNAFYELSLGSALGSYKAYINTDAEFLLSDAVELLPAAQVVLEILEDVVATPDVIQRCLDLRRKGYIFALDDYMGPTEDTAQLLELASIVKFDIKQIDVTALYRLTKEIKHFGKKLLAEKVESKDQVNQCMELGFELFQGYYFAKPTVLAGKKINHSRLTLMQLLTQVLDDAETMALEQTFKQEPGLSINLLRLTNSAASGIRTKITSLRHAITLLGRHQLQRWIQLLLYTDLGGSGPTPLLQLAASRARLLELLAEQHAPGDKTFADSAFMTGIMSLTPALLSLPIQEILAQLSNLPADIQHALRTREGTLGQLLKLAEALDGDDTDQVIALLQQIDGVSPEQLNSCLVKALAWANNINREKPEQD